MIPIVLMIVGFVMVVKGADYLIDGSAAIAKRFHISEMAIGLTIVAFGTSLPELVVNVLASIKGLSDLAVGNILGSNIANVLVVLGVAAIINPITVRRISFVIDIPLTLIVTLLLFILANVSFPIGSGKHIIGKIDGVILLFFFVLYMIYIGKNSKEQESNIKEKDGKEYSIVMSALYIALGVGGLFFGAQWIVDGASYLSQLLNISESFVGLSLVAFGTSVPELATSVIAAKKGSMDMAVGNVIGSNVFNILFVLGISSLINDVSFQAAYNFEIAIIILSGLLLLATVLISKKRRIGRSNGALYLVLYLCYLVYIYYRG